MDSNKYSQKQANKSKNKKVQIEKFNLTKYKHLIRTADDFFEASARCSFDDSVKEKKWPLLVPNITNKAFACELYIKATLYLTKNIMVQRHELNLLFELLNEKDRKEIYNNWLTFAGENIPDCDYVIKMFKDNLEANSDVFRRFRYVHEWAGSTISLESSLKENEMHLHSASISRPMGLLSVHFGFLDQFAKSIKKQINELEKSIKI